MILGYILFVIYVVTLFGSIYFADKFIWTGDDE